MGLCRIKGSTVKQRLRSSFWTSVGACVALFAISLATKPGVRLVDWFAHAPDVRDDYDRSGDLPMERRLEEDESLYPDDLFITRPYREDKLRYVKIVIHIVLIGYMLLGLNTVCDVYFTGAIEMLVETWNIKPDVAGATFMAAGGSAPELFTSLIGATLAMNDVGFGTIVGSAVFNVLFVIGLCGYAAKTAIPLTWWPLFRDCCYYIGSLAVLAGFAMDKEINLIEAIILFLMYICYCLIMYWNEDLQALVDEKVRKAKKQVAPNAPYAVTNGGSAAHAVESNPSTYGRMHDEEDSKTDNITEKKPVEDPVPEATPEREDEPAAAEEETKDGEEKNDEEEEEDDEEDEFYMDYPEGTVNQLIWAVSMPIYGPLYCSYVYVHCPREKAEERMKQFFWVVFFQSLMWIAGFAYLLVWWVTVVFIDVLDFSVTVMGFTLLAAGTSIPDAVSSVAVARAGEGDMAVSSSIGSNIFDILVGLPIPWIIKIALVEGAIKGNSGHVVGIQSPYITFYVILLLCMVAAVIVSIHMLGWKLNRALGLCMAVLYLVFLVVVLFVELVYENHIRSK